MSESEAWRTISGIAAGIDRIDNHLSQVEAKVRELAVAVDRLTVTRSDQHDPNGPDVPPSRGHRKHGVMVDQPRRDPLNRA